MFCIFEGVDGSGKSTAAEKLVTALEERGYSVDLLHRGVPERDVLDEYQFDVEDYRPGNKRAIVADRWHWGDLVYGELYRGASYLGTAGFRFVELFLLSRGAITVLVENDEKTITARLQARGEDYLKLEHVGQVIEHYKRVFNDSITGVMTTDEPEIDRILTQAEFWSNVTADLAPFSTYVGSRTPRVLLVGEKRGNPQTPSVAAFRPTRATNSAAYLLESLPDAIWKEVGMCNAYEEPDLRGLMEVLADPPVIALGRAASDRLSELEIPHAGLPHPSYMRRFHSGQQLNYGQKITYVIGRDTKEFSWPQ